MQKSRHSHPCILRQCLMKYKKNLSTYISFNCTDVKLHLQFINYKVQRLLDSLYYTCKQPNLLSIERLFLYISFILFLYNCTYLYHYICANIIILQSILVTCKCMTVYHICKSYMTIYHTCKNLTCKKMKQLTFCQCRDKQYMSLVTVLEIGCSNKREVF